MPTLGNIHSFKMKSVGMCSFWKKSIQSYANVMRDREGATVLYPSTCLSVVCWICIFCAIQHPRCLCKNKIILQL